MNEIDIYIRVTITILGLAYPILLQVIARLDEKYASTHIVELFNKETVKKFFTKFLIASLLSILIWSFKSEPLFQIDGLNWLINNSAKLLIFINASLLVIFFFLYVNKILVYYTPTKFINYLITEHNKKDPEFKYFNALSDVFLLSIQKQNQNISKTISYFFYNAFKTVREKNTTVPIEYPEDYYLLVYRTIEELAILKDKKNHSLEYRTAGGVWLLGELQGHDISEKTYTWIWNNLLLAVKYEQDDMILYHWERAHQYFMFNLKNINPEFETGTLNVINKDIVEKRRRERNRFLEFHYALGGLLLFKKRYSCILRIFNYTTSEPPRFELLPDHMSQIFNRYIEFRDPYEMKHPWISNKYSFPDQNGLYSDRVIKKWISSYLAILFLRQYSIVPYLSFMKPLDYPALPKTQAEKREWIDNMDFFKQLLTESLSNIELIKQLNLDFITKEWCIDNNILYPIEFIERLKALLKGEYEKGAINLNISLDKEKAFFTSSTNILESTLLLYDPIINSKGVSDDYRNWFIAGHTMIQSKDAFSQDPEAHYLEFDTFLASSISQNIKEGIAETFILNLSKSYLLKPEDIFKALEKFSIDENYLIIDFGLDLSNYINSHKVKGLSVTKFNETQLVSYHNTRIVGKSLFIIKRIDLPIITTKEIDQKLQSKLSLKKISAQFNIYASIIDLDKTNQEIIKEFAFEKSANEITKSLLLTNVLSTEIRWKKNIELIQLIEYSPYMQKGLLNNLSEIKKIVSD